MKRYPFGTDAEKAPSLVKAGFKLAVGAYLGWHVMLGVDRGLGKALGKRLGSVDDLIEKINAWGAKEKT